MKQKLFAAVLSLLSYSAFSQWTTSGNNISNSNTGNVGIGTSVPDTKFHVKSNNTYYPWAGALRVEAPSNVNMLSINHNGVAGTIWAGSGNSTTGPWTPIHFYTGGLMTMTMAADGNVGIGTGTNAPISKLNVYEGDIRISATTTNRGLIFDAVSSVNIANMITMKRDNTNRWMFGSNGNSGVDDFAFSRFSSTGAYLGTPLVFRRATGNSVFLEGNVAIGTNFDNNPNGYKLAVNGKIGAKEVQVENTSATWADYVFKSDYKLMPLNEVEAFIKDNQHLPEIPSADEVKENGHKLGEMDVLLLKKVEEMTLYILEQEKRIKALEEQIMKSKK
jgi:hypothetical protein